jgi:acyl-coenzyme A synthetase/AMP-(fatty) acid ligase
MRGNMSEYENLYQSYKWQVPEVYNFAWDVVHKAARDRFKIALVTVDPDGYTVQRMSFHELDMASNRLANILKKKGVSKGAGVLLMLPCCEEWYVAMIGIMKIGAVAMPTPNIVTSHDLEFRLSRAEAVACIMDNEGASKASAILTNVPSVKECIVLGEPRTGWGDWTTLMSESSDELDRADVEVTKSSDPMLTYFTSGTTGNPKMVRHTHAYAIGHTTTAKFCQDLTKEDVIFVIADTGWAKTVWGKLFGQWIVGAAVMQWKMQGKFDPDVVVRILRDHKVTVFCAPPTVYRMILAQCSLTTERFGSLRHSMSAGEPLNPEIIEAWKRATGMVIYDYYGQTESVALLGNYKFMEIRPGSMGRPTPGHVVEIVDAEGNILPPGAEGHIAVRTTPHPPGLFHGYWMDEELNELVFVGNWYLTGDKAYKDKDGYFWFVGRADDVIKSSGYRIGPFEVESALQSHPAVVESAVIGVPDGTRGQIVMAFVVLNRGYNPSEQLKLEIQEHVKKETAPYKYPRDIEFLNELPKTLSGKIKRAELRKMELERRREPSRDI